MEQDMRQHLDLNGVWHLAFDGLGVGVTNGWPAGAWPAEQAEAVAVPALWTVTHPEQTGVAFYRRLFAAPAGWRGQSVRLCVGGAAYRLDAWLNGRYLGSHEGAYTPFWLDVSGALRYGGQNELVLRVASLSKTAAVDGLLLPQCPASKQSWYYIEAGLWGDVCLEAHNPVWCEALAVWPDLAGRRVVVDVEVRNDLAEYRLATLRLAVHDPGGHLAAQAEASVPALPGVTHHRYALALERPQAWSGEQPALYRLDASLATGHAPADSLSTTFGMRDFTVDQGRFFLNGEPIFLRGVLLQPNYPRTLITPPTPDMMRREITLAKEAGFNMIRTHIRPAPPGFLDLCDELGLLVYAESSLAWIKESPRLLEHGRREVEAMVRRDGNHPSVVIWGILNENRQATALVGEELTRFTRALDPTRVIVDNSGGSLAVDQDFGWTDRATVTPAGQSERQKIIDVHVYIGAPTPDPAVEWLRTLGTPTPAVNLPGTAIGLPAVMEEFYRELRGYHGQVFVSELGCGGMSDLRDTVQRFGDHDGVDARELRLFCDSLEQGFQERGLERVFGALDNLIAAAQEQQAAGDVRQIEAVLANRRASGYCLTQLNDVAWEFHGGIVDLWRRPKRVHAALKRVNRPHCLILEAAPRVVACGSPAHLAVTVVDSAPLPPGAVVVVETDTPDGAAGQAIHLAVPAGAGVKELGALELEGGSAPGLLRVRALLYGQDGDLLAESAETVALLPTLDARAACAAVQWLGLPPPVLGPAARLAAGRLLGVARPGSLAERDWDALLSSAAAGAVAVIGPLQTADQVAIAALNARGLKVRVEMGMGSWMGHYHWLPASPLSAGLPAGGLAGEVHASVIPHYVLGEQGGDVLAGSLRNTNSRFASPAMLWFSDVEAVPYGQGTLLFCQYRVFEQATPDPLAARLLINVIDVARAYLNRVSP